MTGNYTFDFFILLAIAWILRRYRFLVKPFTLMEVFFHEVSHGLVNVLTLGKVYGLRLQWAGGGVCVTQGGSQILTALAGYCGAVVWGACIYLMGVYAGAQTANTILTSLIGFMVLVTLFWVRNLQTFIIMMMLVGLLGLPMYFHQLDFTNYLLQIIGLFVAVSAVQSPLHLIDGKLEGDGAFLTSKTLLPEGVWILFWVCWGLLGLLYMWHIPLPAEERIVTSLPFLS